MHRSVRRPHGVPWYDGKQYSNDGLRNGPGHGAGTLAGEVQRQAQPLKREARALEADETVRRFVGCEHGRSKLK
jgi:hypothetical protein